MLCEHAYSQDESRSNDEVRDLHRAGGPARRYFLDIFHVRLC
jgi:hypothetical protein